MDSAKYTLNKNKDNSRNSIKCVIDGKTIFNSPNDSQWIKEIFYWSHINNLFKKYSQYGNRSTVEVVVDTNEEILSSVCAKS